MSCKLLLLFAVVVLSLAATSHASLTVNGGDGAAWSRLFGMSPLMQLESLDPLTGQPIEVGPSLAYEAQGQGLSTIDPDRSLFYIIGTNMTSPYTISLISVSCASGGVVAEIPLPFLLEAFVGIGQFVNYDRPTKSIIAVGRSAAVRDSHEILRVNPETGAIRRIAVVGDFQPIEVLGGFGVLDQANEVEWLMLAQNATGPIYIKFYGYSTRSGDLLNIIDNPVGLVAAAFDSRTKLVYGIGTRVDTTTNKYVRTLVTLNSQTAQFNLVGDIKGYLGMLAAISALDENGRILYALMQPATSDGGPTHDPAVGMPWDILNPGLLRNRPTDPSLVFDLVAIDLGSGAVLHVAPNACDIQHCPWNLHFLNV